jgi:hypothetical protein
MYLSLARAFSRLPNDKKGKALGTRLLLNGKTFILVYLFKLS